MLSRSTLRQANAAAEILAAQGIQVGVSFDGRLAALMRASYPVSSDPASLDQQADCCAVLHEKANNDFHTDLLSETADELAKEVEGVLRFVKLQVSPRVAQFAQDYRAALANYSFEPPSSGFEIVSCKVPELATADVFLQSLPELPQITEDFPSIAIRSRTEDEVRKAIHLGEEAFDELVDKWLASIEVASVFEDLKDLAFNSSYYIRRVAINPQETLNLGLMAYLFTPSIKESVEDGNDGVSLVTYQTRVELIISLGAFLIRESLKEFKQAVDHQRLVFSYDHDKRRVYVNEVVYQENLGGLLSAEVVLGCLLLQTSRTSLQDVLDLAPKALSEWAGYCEFTKKANEQKATEALHMYLRSRCLRELTEICDKSEEEIFKNEAYAQSSMKRVDECIDRLELKDLSEPDDLALCLVAGCLYFNTAAYEILSEFRRLEKESEGKLSALAAASLAAWAYLMEVVLSELGAKQATQIGRG